MRTKSWIWSAVALLAFLIIAALLHLLLQLGGWERLLLWIGMTILGVTAAIFTFFHFSPRKHRPRRSDVDVLLDAASKRLAAAGIASGRIGRLPVTLVLGPSGSAKTSTVIQGEHGAELLAGEAEQGGAVMPTPAVNVWYDGDGLLVEAGGSLYTDEEGWTRLLRRLRANRWAAALGRGRQAPRAAVVCVSADLLLSGAAAPAVADTARTLRQALAIASRQLGVRLPVYVVFTKVDRIPHFEAFVRGMSRHEAQELLGATLPIVGMSAEEYGETQGARLRQAFSGIFHSLARWRLTLLPREQREMDRGSAYEFPREMRKFSDAASAFLLELCRPGQLGMNPFLRGFYFTGVRPVVVSDTPTPAAAPGERRSMDLGATGVFAVGGTPATPQPPSGRPGTRRVPEWVFLRRLHPEVVRIDEHARALTAGGARVDLLRRALLGIASLALLVLVGGMTISYWNNRAMLAHSQDALTAVQMLTAPVDEAPDLPSLQRLDSLRRAVEPLSGYRRDGRPMRLRWGLYSGDHAREPLSQVYFDRFASQLFSQTRGDLVTHLQTLPDEPQHTADYSGTYDALKAYLISTSHPHESDPGFLTPVLLRAWRHGDQLDPDRRSVASEQLDFYGRELLLGNPFPGEPNEAVVVTAREFLARFTGVEPLYQALLAEAAEVGEPIRFAELYPTSSQVVQNPQAVPAEFTVDGWARAEEILGDLDRLLAREDWVLGDRGSIAPTDRVRLAEELRARYRRDYGAAWQAFLEAASVTSFSGAADAASKLERLSSNQSPILQLLALTARHTAVDTVLFPEIFQPVHTVIPAGENEAYVNEGNAGYMNGLLSLHAAMAQVAQAAGPDRAAALSQAQTGVQQVDLQVSQLAQRFRTEGEALAVGDQVQRLLQAPVSAAGGLVRALPTADVNAAGAGFCAPFSTIAARYPFADGAVQQASMDDLVSTFQPGASHLWSFYEERLGELLVRQGVRYAPRPLAEPRPSEEFVEFFNRAADISAAFFPDGAGTPTVRFALQLATSDELPEVRFTMDGQTGVFTRTMPAGRTFVWDGAGARSVRVTSVVDGVETVLLEGEGGPWTLTRLLREARWEQVGAQQYRLNWSITEAPGQLVGTITFAGRLPVFAPDALRLQCVSRIVR